MKELIIYDDTVKPNEMIREIIGDRGFGSVVVKHRRLREFYKEYMLQMFPDMEWERIDSGYAVDSLRKKLQREADGADNVRILHCFSDHIISSYSQILLTYKKLPYIDCCIRVQSAENGECAAVMFCNVDEYTDFLKECQSTEKAIKTVVKECKFAGILAKGLEYIGEISSFIQCITGNFDSRYFNTLKETGYRIRKSSNNKKKIKSEYQYYHLLPENMKSWFVMPFDYYEDGETAGYTMERLHMPDLAVRWVHGSVGEDEFAGLMDMYFYFFQERGRKNISEEEYLALNTKLYVDKVKDRLEELKSLPAFERISKLLRENERLHSVDFIFEWYLKVKEKVETRVSYPAQSVIGHGDPCFANALYSRSTRMLKFIDPKGALCEAELWMNPYYDIAKLSHSVCGNYDFFNNAMYDIEINTEFDYQLNIPFSNERYKQIFREKSEENGYDYWTVRVYEASLFLSMLPLHMDAPHKVFGFILNTADILEEIEKNV